MAGRDDIGMRNGIKYDWNALASLLANEDSKVQRDFFNTFAKELLSSCGSNHNAEMQACFINQESDGSLTDAARRIFSLFSDESNQ